MKVFKKNLDGYKVLTPDGYKDFAGVALMGHKEILRLEFSGGYYIECTLDHKIYTSESTYIEASVLNIGDTVESLSGEIEIVNKIYLKVSEDVYDLIEVEGGHKYYTNTILSSNCKFITYEETLINPTFLSELRGMNPIMVTGQCRWYKQLSRDKMYTIALDPSLGTGGNSAGIQVVELPTFEQVAEWHHNLTPIQGQIKILKDILSYIQETIGIENNNNIFWSIENNAVGEAGLVCIKEIGEENFPGLFLSEPLRKGHVKKFRRGFNTTHKSKINAAARLKYLIESKKMKIYSKPLISELKTYIASGASFKAKVGQEDDLVSALLLIVRMGQVLSDWDHTVFETFSTRDDVMDEDFEYPMPIFVSTY
jgi:intein/homing endonuclease